MPRRDVDLVIKARDQAASVIDSITKALNQFIDAQKGLDSRADKTETTLTSLGAAIGKLDQALKGLDAKQKLTTDLQAAAASLSRLEAEFKGTQSAVAGLEKSIESASQVQARYKAKLEDNLKVQERQKAVIAKAKVDQKELTQAYEQAAAAQEKLQRRQEKLPSLIERASTAAEKAARRFNDLSAQVAGTEKPTRSLVESLATSERRLAETGQKLTKLRDEFSSIGSKINVAGSAFTLFSDQAARAGQNLTKQQGILASMALNYEKINKQSSAVAQKQNQLAGELNRSRGALARQNEQLQKTRAEMSRIGATTDEARQKLAQLAGQGFATLTRATQDQRRAMLETKKAFVDAQAESTRLGAAISKVRNPSELMLQTFRSAAAETLRLKGALIEQRRALTEMNGALNRASQDYRGVQRVQVEFLAILERLSGALDKGAIKAREEAAALQKLRETTAGASGNVRRLTTDKQALATASERAATATSRLAAAYRQFYGDTRRSLSLLQRIRGEVLSLIAAYGGLYGIIRALDLTVDATQKLEAATARLNVAFDNDTVRVEKEFDFIRRTADRLGVSLGDLATEYSKFNIATKNTSIEGAAARKIFIQIAEAARVNRSNTKELSGVFVALTQIVSKGAVQMEELRQQLGDRLPGAIQIMADGLGVTTAELIKMMEQGQITEAALVNFADEVSKRFGGGLEEALLGITVALGRMQNAAFQAAAEFGEGGFISGLTRFANTVTETLRSADFIAFTRNVSKAFGTLFDALAFLAQNFQVVVTGLTALIAFKLTPVLLALVSNFRDVGKAAIVAVSNLNAIQAWAASAGVHLSRTTIAISRLKTAMKGLVGSTGIGLAFIAISTAIAAWSTEADSATEALVRHRDIVDKVKNAYEAAGGASENWAKTIRDVTKQQAEVSLAEITREFAKARRGAVSDLTAIGEAFNPIIGGSEETQRELQDLRKRFLEGSISVNDYKKALEAIADADPSLDLDFIVNLQDSADDVRELEEAFENMTLVMQGFSDSLDEAQAGMDALNGVIDPGLADKMSGAMKELANTMKALDGLLPGTKTDMEAVAEAAEAMARAYEAALTAARALPETIQRIAAEQAVLNQFGQGFVDLQKRALDFALDNTLVDRIIGVESAGDRFAKNSESTATGLGQFIARTWVEQFRKHFPDRAAGMTKEMILALRTDAALSREMVQLYIRDNAVILQRMGIALTDANLYLAHFLGPAGAAKVIQSAPGTPISSIVGPGVMAANPILNGKDREALIRWAQQKVGFSEQELAVLEEQARIVKKLAEDEEEARDRTKDRLADGEFEIEQQRRINEGKEREAAIEAEIRKAREENPAITPEDIAKIREQTGALFDLEQAQKRAKDADKDASAAARDASEKVNALLAKRKALFDQLEIAQKQGDTALQEQLKASIEGINEELTEAIDNARALWEAVGGTDATNALIKLDTAKLKADGFAEAAKKVYLDWSRVADLFVTGLASAFDSFARKVADGENVFHAARDAFLQFAADFLLQIAQMIIQQAILNALTAAFGGTAFGSLIGLGHTGGIVGSSRVGSGNAVRNVNPAIFARALRYHEGGVVGLRPGEVPIIAKQGEEMLTRDDPRHALNGGGKSGSSPQVNVRNINTFDAAGFLQAALDTPFGEKVLFNFVSANPDKFRAAMGAN